MKTSLALPLAIGGAFAFASTLFLVGDSDVFWHLATARDMLARGLGAPDTFSWTAAGRPVATDQWLGQLLFYGAYLAGGWRGIVALRALAVLALVALVVYAALDARPGGRGPRARSARPLVAVLASLPAIALSRFAWTERPELLGVVLFALVIPLLRAGRAGGDRALVACVLLVAIWANVHGSFALGVVLVGLVCAEGALRDRARRRIYVAAALATLAASLATPAGLGAWTAPGSHLLSPPRDISEWAVPDVTTLPGALFAVALVAVLAVAHLARERDARDAVVLVPLAFLALTATRQMPLFAIAAAPYLAARLPLPDLRGVRRPPQAATLVTATFAAFALAIGVARSSDVPDLGGYPVSSLASLPGGRGLLNGYDWGGFLIWEAPATPVFVDGRLVPYLGPVLDDYRAVVGVHPDYREVIARRGIRVILVRPADPIAVRARDLGWRVLSSGPDHVLIDVSAQSLASPETRLGRVDSLGQAEPSLARVSDQ